MSAFEPPLPIPAPNSTLAQAALANRDIRSFLDDPRYAAIWTVEGVTRHLTVRVVFEHAEVIGGSGESLAAARHKNFGPFLGIQPLRPDDPVHPYRILFVYGGTSPYNRRVEQRRHLKRLLGRQYRTLVTKAARSTKQDFLKYDLTPDRGQGHPPPAQARPRPVLAGRQGPGVPRIAGPTPATSPLRGPGPDLESRRRLNLHAPIPSDQPLWHNNPLPPTNIRGETGRNTSRVGPPTNQVGCRGAGP